MGTVRFHNAFAQVCFAMQRLLAQGRPAKFACSNANCPHIQPVGFDRHPPGFGGNFATRRTSQVKFTTKAPIIIPPNGPVERTLFLGPNVGTLVTFLLAWDFSVTTGKCFRPARATRQGEGSFVNAMWLAGSFCLFVSISL